MHLKITLPVPVSAKPHYTSIQMVVLLQGFQKGRDIKASYLKEKGREQFWPKKGNLHRKRKNRQNFTPLGSPDGAGIINYQYFFKGQGAPCK
jgi:CDP-glycerol glycerophosphotransferase (TagB/SpsB family)